MKGDIIIVEKHHIDTAKHIVNTLIELITNINTVFCLSVAGESGSGKSETGKAIADHLENKGIKCLLLGQDDYFVLPPKSNDSKRRKDPEWLGPHLEIKMDELENNLFDAKRGKTSISKPLIDYNANKVLKEKISLNNIKVIIVEGTYTSLLKNIDIRIFIDRNRFDTIKHRQKRNRGNEVSDPFVEKILEIEHKIIAGHKQLADIIITKGFEVVIPSDSFLTK